MHDQRQLYRDTGLLKYLTKNYCSSLGSKYASQNAAFLPTSIFSRFFLQKTFFFLTIALLFNCLILTFSAFLPLTVPSSNSVDSFYFSLDPADEPAETSLTLCSCALVNDDRLLHEHGWNVYVCLCCVV